MGTININGFNCFIGITKYTIIIRHKAIKNNDEEIYLNEKYPDISPSYIVKTIEPSMLKIMNFPISLVLAVLIKI